MNPIDRIIGFFSPEQAVKRASLRAQANVLEAESIRQYEGASRGRRMSNWRTTSSSANVEIAVGGRVLRDRARDLVRNNPTAANIVSIWTNYLVGPGIMPRAATGEDKLDKLVDEVFEEWTKRCVSGMDIDFYGMQSLACRIMVESGEGLVRRRVRRESDGFRIPLQLQVMEPDIIDESRLPDRKRSRLVLNGVEFDTIGRKRGYWLHPHHPGEHQLFGLANSSNFVRAEDIVHLFEPLRTQVRGVPWLHSIIVPLKDVDDYNHAENVRKKIEACVVGMVVPGENEVPNIAMPEVDGAHRSVDGLVTDANGFPVERFEPGMIAYLPNGKDIRFNNPAISAGQEMYLRTQYRRIAAGARIPYELVSGDWSQANFASGKMGFMNFRRLVTSLQWNIVIPVLCQPVWDWFVSAGQIAGVLPDRLIPVEWQPPEFEDIQPLDDARADLIAVRMGKKSILDVISKSGRNPRTVIREIVETNKILDENGVVLDSDPRRVAINGQMQWGGDASAAAGEDGDRNAN